MIISKQQDVLSSHDTLMKRRSTWLRFELLASVKVHLCASGWRLFILPIKTTLKEILPLCLLIGSLELVLHLPSIHYCLLSKHKTV